MSSHATAFKTRRAGSSAGLKMPNAMRGADDMRHRHLDLKSTALKERKQVVQTGWQAASNKSYQRVLPHAASLRWLP
jgi:hypothetical protein